MSEPVVSAEAVATPVALPFQVGARTLASVKRRLVRLSVPLEQALDGVPLTLPGLPPQADGYFIRALPDAMGEALHALGLRAFVRQSYPRHYARLDLDFDAWFASLSGNARSTLKRKRRKLAEASGGTLDVRQYSRPGEVGEFFSHARAVSADTYQERLLDAGLPADALPEMRALAERGAMRGWLLFLGERPIAYLYAPAQGRTLLYAYLGYRAELAPLSPGSVLQLEAMRMLLEEKAFAYFDFTEGDGQHKRQFATAALPSHDLLLVRDTFGNRTTLRTLDAFDSSVALAKRAVRRLGLGGVARAVRR
ncbi:GNAT family N-acetyltransferase [Sphingosinicella sp. YJ22]|uniref:GNAT family N-acetyltransferase n=1 Tax=Sphingosinicella sp. YJ22 TaxID=1104780 RepID=UPI00140B7BB3|nr:GNAT family N-acetyltransferase [Sphingosinicella sp. YJ22]